MKWFRRGFMASVGALLVGAVGQDDGDVVTALIHRAKQERDRDGVQERKFHQMRVTPKEQEVLKRLNNGERVSFLSLETSELWYANFYRENMIVTF